ncbi:MAG: hypothetical protein L0Z07_09365, partial [Planctomycetes bacterium]|nr:hypothetical protein [Planctomycetota bacterium]
MNHNRLHAKNWLLVGFASWFLGGVGMAGAPPANRIVGDRQPTASQSPLIVENPYATRQPAAAQA